MPSRLLSPLLLVATLSLHTTAARAETRTPLGLSAPLSGDATAWGNDLKNVLKFANEKIAGGKYSLVIEDDRCDPKTAVSIAHKLAKVSKVPAVFTVCGAVTLAAGPVYDKAGTVVMAPLATPSMISNLGERIFRASLSDAIAASALADAVRSAHTKVGILTEQNAYSEGFANDFRKRAGQIGLEVVSEDFQSGDTDLKGQLLRLQSRAPDAIFINTNTERTFTAILKQMSVMQFVPTRYGAYMPGASSFLAAAGAMAEGIIFVDLPKAEELLNEEGRKLYQEYLSRYGALQGWTFIFPAGFEAFRSIHQAITSGKPINEYLHSTEFSGIFGMYSFDKSGDIRGLRHSIRVIKGGQNVPVESQAGS